MRKQTKLVAVLSAAALLAIGASMTSFAATPHWDQQDGEWVFLDRNGDRMNDVWKKSNGQWYYLDSDGYMAREQVIEDDDDKYYVDANGARVTNAWVSLDNDDLYDDSDDSESIDTVWMYFDATGKALGAGTDNGEIKRVPYGDGQSGYFIFDEDGYMLSGWKKWDKTNGQSAEGDLYYLGTQDEGWARTSFHYLEIDPDIPAFDDIDEDDDLYEDEAWFYFKSNGKAYVDDTAKYNNKTYAFDSWGRMLDSWVFPGNVASNSELTNSGTSEASSSAPGAAYYNEDDGDRVGSDWVIAYPKSNYDNYDDDPYYFYLNSKGEPFRAEKGSRLTDVAVGVTRVDDDTPDPGDADNCATVGARAIDGETYLFNANGVMLTGLYKVPETTTLYKGTTKMDPGYYYFTVDDIPSSNAGKMVTNKRIVIDVDGDDETYYFDKSGKAYTMRVISGYIYGADGKLITDYGDGNTYERVSISELVKDTEYEDYTTIIFRDKNNKQVFSAGQNDEILINENGKIKKGSKAKDINDEDVFLNDYLVDQVKTAESNN